MCFSPLTGAIEKPSTSQRLGSKVSYQRVITLKPDGFQGKTLLIINNSVDTDCRILLENLFSKIFTSNFLEFVVFDPIGSY